MNLDKESIRNAYLKLPDYQKTLIPVGVILLLAGLYVYLVYMPLMDEEEAHKKTLESKQAEVAKVRAVADELPKFEAQQREIEAQLVKALTQLPSNDELPKLLRDMEVLGKDSGIEFINLKMGKERKQAFYAEVPVILKLQGGYHDTAIFFDKLSKLPRIINVSKLNIGNPKKSEGRIELSIDCVATTYKFLSDKK